MLPLLGSIQYYNDLTEFIRTEKSNASERFRAMNKRLIRDRNSYLYKPADDVYAVPRVVMPHGATAPSRSTLHAASTCRPVLPIPIPSLRVSML